MAPILTAFLTSVAAASPQEERERRLESLDPVNPVEYFELAEDVADAASGADDINLARRLYLLAWETASKDPGRNAAPPAMPTGVCLALADLSTRQDERRWLFALADAVGENDIDQGDADPSGLPPADAPEFAVAEALGLHRAGEHRRAQAALEPRDRQQALLALEGVLETSGERLLREIQTTSICVECRNRRIVRESADPESRWRLCSTCGGDPGRALSVAQTLSQMRAEAILLRAAPPTWSAQLAIDPSPSRPLDREEAARRLNVDLQATIYRDGRWVEPARPPAAAPPTSP